jgi:CubicO group peptidase (beta-lactamase class C family)
LEFTCDFATGVGDSVGSAVVFNPDAPNKRPNRIDTRFGTASAGKAFVATAIMRLIEDRQLTLNTEIGDVLEFDLNAISPNITVRQLLNHTSGAADYFDESVMDDYEELWQTTPNYTIRSGKDLLPLFREKPMVSAPGEKFAYNNSGYVLLGLIIEATTGVPLDAYLDRAVFEPCGMVNTGYYELDRLPANTANGYIVDEDDGGLRSNIFSVDAKGSGAGGAFTTVDDVERFWTHLLGGHLVSRELVEQMLAVQADCDDEVYGFGFWLGGDDNRVPYFEGSDPGVSFISSYDKNGLFVCVISNYADDVWEAHSDLRDYII